MAGKKPCASEDWAGIEFDPRISQPVSLDMPELESFAGREVEQPPDGRRCWMEFDFELSNLRFIQISDFRWRSQIEI